MTGRSIAHYQILEKLGEGGMGVVYKARDIHLDRLVAIKVLPAQSVANPERKRRFVQEAKTASALNHPNIVAKGHWTICSAGGSSAQPDWIEQTRAATETGILTAVQCCS